MVAGEDAEPAPDGDSAVPPRPRKRASRKLISSIIVAVVVVIAGVSVYEYEYSPGGPLNPYIVSVHQVLWTENGGALSAGPGFVRHAGLSQDVYVSLPCTSYFGFAQNCKTGSAYVQTPGFGVASTNAPATWSSGSTNALFQVYVQLLLPDHAYNGNVTIDLH